MNQTTEPKLEVFKVGDKVLVDYNNVLVSAIVVDVIDDKVKVTFTNEEWGITGWIKNDANFKMIQSLFRKYR